MTEFEKLQKENEQIRDTIAGFIEEWGGDKEEIWLKINELIENELQQEDLCNK